MASAANPSGLIFFLKRHKVGALFLGAFFLRACVGLVLYLLAYRYNAFQTEEILNNWLLAPDATKYHQIATALQKVWLGLAPVFTSEMPDSFLGYPVMLAGIYTVLGSYYIYGIILNSLAFLVMGHLAYRLALMLGHEKTPALCLSLLICLWPPSLAYSSVLLKDSLFLLAVFGLLFFLIFMLKNEAPGAAGGLWSALGLVASCLLLANIRPEFILVGLAFGGLCALTAAAVQLFRRRFASLLRPALVFALVLAALWGAKLFPLGSLARPRPLIPVPHLQQGFLSPLPSRAPLPDGQARSLPAQKRLILAGGWGYLPEVVSAALNRLGFALVQRRLEYAQSGGITLTPKAHLMGTGPRTWSYLAARGLVNLLVFPYPWENWPPRKSRKANVGLSLAVTGQAVLWYALLPGIFAGLIIRIRQRPLPGLVLAWWILGLGVALGLIVVNLGTLYRQRDMVFLPMILLFSVWPYAWLANLLKRPKKVKGGRQV